MIGFFNALFGSLFCLAVLYESQLKHGILCCMAISYIIPILHVFWRFRSSHFSISSLLFDKQLRSVAIWSLHFMSIFTLLYESLRSVKLAFLSFEMSSNNLCGFSLLNNIFDCREQPNVMWFYSFISIVFLLIGIYGVLLFDETQLFVHYSFALLAFGSILYFMFLHIQYMCLFPQNLVCDIPSFFVIPTHETVFFFSYIFLIQLLIFVKNIYHIRNNVFFYELLFLANFAVFYFYLHWMY